MTVSPYRREDCSEEKMIDISQDTLLRLLIRAFLCGVVLGLVYESIRAFKMLCGIRYDRGSRIKRGRVRAVFEYSVTFFCDVIFWLIAGATSIILMYHSAKGIFRGMTYLGLASGFLFYYLLFGRFMLKLNGKIIGFVRSSVKKAFRLISVPAKKIIRLAISLYHLTIGRLIGKIKEERKKRHEAEFAAVSENSTYEEEHERKEDYAYALGNAGYKGQGRVSFGRKAE